MSEQPVPTTLIGAMEALTEALRAHTEAMNAQFVPLAEVSSVPAQQFFCSSCVSKKAQVEADLENGVLYDGDTPVVPRVNMAVVWLPSWQTNSVQGQVLMACIALPSCLACTIHREDSIVEKMTKSGLALPGAG
jgi:hypothetical protein